MLKKQIPNIFTLLNLLSGIVAVLLAVTDKLVEAAFFVFLGIFFDFFDGFFARKFNVEGDFGKQLDSLADMITSGLVPGIIMFQLILYSTKEKYFMQISSEIGNWDGYAETYFYFIPAIGLIIPLASAYRLAKFNLDERQSSSFIGLPTPALSLFVVALPLILHYSNFQFFIDLINNMYVLISITILGSYLLNADMPLFSLKFKNYSWRDNQIKFVFLISSIILLFLLKVAAVPILIILYLVFSAFENMTKNKVT